MTAPVLAATSWPTNGHLIADIARLGYLTGCWVWKGASNRHGYGALQIGSVTDDSRRTVRAHRFAYEQAVGPIPDDLQLDHLCRNRACVNPDHLEPVTPGENSRRGMRWPHRHGTAA